MTFSTDQLKSDKPLSKLGRLIIDNRDTILKRWEKSVREKMPEAKELALPILMDTLPAFVENIAEAVTSNHSRPSANVYSTLANEHGGERARLTNYSHEHLIKEYQILRWIFIQTLNESGANIEVNEMMIINASIDDAIQEAAATFALVQSGLREQYIATLSHDMKNPLGSISMSSELILKKPENLEHVIKQAIKIRNNAVRINKMIEDLLDITAIGTTGRLKLKLDRCNILHLVEHVLDELNEKLSSRIKLSAESIEGYWDQSYLSRAIENLVTNALKYSAENSEITILVSGKFERLFISIHNIGNPIPVEERECIFQVFRRAAAAKSGTNKGWGLGLPLVRAVAEAHGGSVGVESSIETGTTFIIDIPVDGRPFQDAPVT